VTGQHEADAGSLEALDRIPRVVDDVSLTAGAGNGKQMVVKDEDLEVCRHGGELLLDPHVATSPDLTVVEVRLARVDGDDRDRPLPEDGVALSEHLLEVHVADVPRVVVTRHDDDRVAVDAIEVLPRGQVLVAKAERREVTRADDDVRLELVDLPDRPLEQARLEVRLPAVQIRKLRDPEHSRSLRLARASSEALGTLAWVRVEDPVFQAYCGSEPPRFANRIEVECAKILDYYGVPWDYEPQSFVLERDENGRVVSAFTPDFYLPEQNLFIEVTVMKQSLVTRKNRKLREIQRLYPHVRVKLFYRRDIERLAQRYRLQLAS
jgi:hypothetical protein